MYGFGEEKNSAPFFYLDNHPEIKLISYMDINESFDYDEKDEPDSP